MKASETSLQPVIEGKRQYVVPLYQRSYSWDKKQWQTLWEDLVDLCDPDGPRSHFLGSLVTMQTTSVPEGVPKYFLIDGQQRLTTIFILLALLRDRAKKGGEEELAEEIEKDYLVNSFKKGNEYFKILPTQSDRAAFQNLICRDGASPETESRVLAAYRFFEGKIRLGVPSIPELVKAITENLAVVSIVLDRDDNPYLVFESLNAKGEPLTQADLIRNFFFLKIHADQQDEMHRRYWQPMQDALGDRLTEFIRHYLTAKQGAFVRSDSVYFTLKNRPETGDPLALLGDLSRFSKLSRRIYEPSEEPDPALRDALQRLKDLDVTTASPFLLLAYDQVEAGILTRAGMAEIVGFIENLIIRRFVCNLPTSHLNKVFPPLFHQIKAGGYSGLRDGARRILATKGYPKDREFRKRLVESKLYGAGDRRVRTKVLLVRIERSFGHKETVNLDDPTLEHIMPQTLTDEWRSDLGDDWEATHELLLHTLGNLTLTGYNAEMSNANFTTKKQRLTDSNLSLNKGFASRSTWGRDEIERRGEELAEIAIGIWPYFGDEPREPDPDPIDKKTPKSLRFLGRDHPVKSWRDVLETTINTAIADSPIATDVLAETLPAFLANQVGKFRDSRKLACGLYVEMHGSAKTLNRWCERVLEVFEIDEDEWEVEVG